MQRDKQYYASLFEKTLSQFTTNEQVILRDFNNHLNQIISGILGAYSSIASEKIAPQQGLVTSLFLSVWNIIPEVGTYISKGLTMAANKYEEANAQRLNSILGNFAHKDVTAEIFCQQAIVYHHAHILDNQLESTHTEAMFANVKAAAKAVIAKFLPEKIKLSPAHEALTSELLTELMKSLNLAVDAYKQGDLAIEQLGDFLAQKLVVVNDAPLTPDFNFKGKFNQLIPDQRYPIALDALRLSSLAYENKALIASHAKHWGYDLRKPESFYYQFKNGNRCIVLANQDTVLCLFRGSSELLNDAPSALNMIHAGFKNALHEMWDGTQGLGDRLSYHAKFPPKRFIFVGHSTGGAIALLAAARFYQQYQKHQDKISVFTFSQPRVGNNLSKSFAENVCRFVHPNDPIPSLPPESLGFEHIGTEYSLPDETEIFNWEDKHVEFNLLKIDREAYQLTAYQARLIAHAKSHSTTALPAYLAQSTPEINAELYQLGETVFHDAFKTKPTEDQLSTLRIFTRVLIQELCQAGGNGFTHPIKNHLARLDSLSHDYTQDNKTEHSIEIERLIIWLKLAAYQKQDKTSLNKLFKMLSKMYKDTQNKEFSRNLAGHLKTLGTKAQFALGNESLAPLILIDAFMQMPNPPLHAIEKLRDILSTHPLMHYIVRIRLLELLLRQAQVTQDISLILLAPDERIDLARWIYRPLPAIPEDKQVKDYLQYVLNQLLVIEQDNPIVQALIKANQSTTASREAFLNTLKEISEDETRTPQIRLHALQIRQIVQLLDYAQQPTNALATNDEAIDITPTSMQLTYEDHVNLGELALLAEEYALAKKAYIQAYHCIQASDDKSTLAAPQQRIMSKINYLLWKEAGEATDAWSKTLIYQEILKFDPTNQAAIAAVFEQGLGDVWHDFERHLQNIGTKITPSEIETQLNAKAVLLQTPFNGTWVLNQQAINAFNKRQSIRGSIHKVAAVGPLHIKENPGAVGLAFAAWALSRWLFLGLPRTGEWGFVPVQPAKILIKDEPVIVVQISPTVEGDNLQTLLSQNSDPVQLTQLDPTHFGAQVIASILLNMGDARDANFILHSTKLISIDNDHVLIRDEVESGLLSSQIIIKNLVFCLSQMQNNISPDLAAHLAKPTFSPLSRIRAWLYSLHHYNQMIETQVFKDKLEHQKLFERANENEQVVLPVFFDSQGILQPCTKLMTLCSALRKSPEISHQELFAKVRKKLATHYASAFQNTKGKTLLGRMEIIGGLTGCSLSTTGKIISQNIGNSVRTHKQFIQTQHNPKDVLQALRNIEKNDDLIDSIAQEISEGNINTFAREEVMQELVLEKLNETHYMSKNFTLQTHQALILAISSTVKRLKFKYNPYLTDEDLLSLIRLPTLEHITLIACPKIKGTFPRTGDLAGVLPKINWLEPWLARTGQKTLDLQDCDAITPEFLSLMAFLNVQNATFTGSFFSESYNTPLGEYSYLAISHLHWGLLIPPLIFQPRSSPIAILYDDDLSLDALAGLPNGGFIGASRVRGWVKHWQRQRNTWVCVATLLESNVSALAAFPDGNIITGSDTTIKHWSWQKKQWICIDTLHESCFRLAVLPDGSFLSFAHAIIQHWQRQSNKWICIATLQKGCDIFALPDGSFIVGDRGAAWEHWQLKNGNEWKCVAMLPKEPSAVLWDGSFINIPRWGGEKGNIQYWHRKTNQWIQGKTWQVKVNDGDEIEASVVLSDGSLIGGLYRHSITQWQIFSPGLAPNLTGKRERNLYNALQLLQRGSLYPPHVPQFFPDNLTTLDVSDSCITEVLLIAILKHCPQLTLDNIQILNCEWLSEKIKLLHTIKKQAAQSELFFENLKFNDDDFLAVLPECTFIQELTLKSCAGFQGRILKELQINGIKKLTIINCPSLDFSAVYEFEKKAQTSLVLDCVYPASENYLKIPVPSIFSISMAQTQNHITALVALPDGDLLSGSQFGPIQRWQRQENRWICISTIVEDSYRKFSDCLAVPVRGLAILPDGGFIVHSLYGYIYQWHQQKNKWEGSWIVSNSKRCCYTLAVFSDGSFICSVSVHAIQYWQKQKNNWVCMAEFRGHEREIYILAVFPNGDFISGSGDYTIKHWQREKNEWVCAATLDGHKDYVFALSIFADGSFISGSKDNTIKYWQRYQNKWICVATLEGHKGCVNVLTILSDNSFASGSQDNTIKYWQRHENTWVCIATLTEHEGPVRALAGLPDGSLVSGSWDHTIKQWQILPPSPALTLPCKESNVNHALQLLQKGFLHPTLVPKLIPNDLITLDVSNTRIADPLLKAILDQCPNLTEIKIENCIWLTDEGRSLVAQRATKHTQATALAQWSLTPPVQNVLVNNHSTLGVQENSTIVMNNSK